MSSVSFGVARPGKPAMRGETAVVVRESLYDHLRTCRRCARGLLHLCGQGQAVKADEQRRASKGASDV